MTDTPADSGLRIFPAHEEVSASDPSGTAEGNPVAGVTISEEDRAHAVVDDVADETITADPS